MSEQEYVTRQEHNEFAKRVEEEGIMRRRAS